MPSTASQHGPQTAVPPGVALSPKPGIPESNDPYFLAQIGGNITKCSGCTSLFRGTCPPPPPDHKFVIGDCMCLVACAFSLVLFEQCYLLYKFKVH